MHESELLKEFKKEDIERYDYIAINELITDDYCHTTVHPICFVAAELLNGNIEIRKIDLDNSETSDINTGIVLCINQRIGVFVPTLHTPDVITTTAVGNILEIRIK